MSEQQARAVGVLSAKADHFEIVDVTVVEGAVHRGDAVVTSNERHIRHLIQAAGARLSIQII